MGRPQAETVVGYFETRNAAEQTLYELRRAGFTSEQVGLVTPPAAGAPRRQIEGGKSILRKIGRLLGGKTLEQYKATEFKGSVEYPGVTPERERYFEYRLTHSSAGALVTVNAQGRGRIAEQIIQRAGGDLGANASAFLEATRHTENIANAVAQAGAEGRTIQLFGEVVRVRRERVPLGEIRLRKEIVTETRNVEVPVSREELVIERRPANQSDFPNQISTESEIRIPLTEERIIIEKSPTEPEEAETAKRDAAETQVGSQQVRAEPLQVNQKGEIRGNEEAAAPPKVKRSA